MKKFLSPKSVKILNSDFFGEAHAQIVTRLMKEEGLLEVKRGKNNYLGTQWGQYLSTREDAWRLFCTFTTQGGLTALQVERHVGLWFEMVLKQYNRQLKHNKMMPKDKVIGNDDLSIFWVAESNAKNSSHEQDRFHVHMLIACNDYIFNDVYHHENNKYRPFNVFDKAWQYAQGRKPFIWKSDADGVKYKHELEKFRVQLLPLNPIDNKNATSGFKKSRIRYVTKYLTKDLSQFGVLNPKGVQTSLKFEGEYFPSNSYEYEYVKSNGGKF